MDRSSVIEESLRATAIIESSFPYVDRMFVCTLYERVRRAFVRDATGVADVRRGAVFRSFRGSAGSTSVSFTSFVV